jgi:hypothetical protein
VFEALMEDPDQKNDLSPDIKIMETEASGEIEEHASRKHRAFFKLAQMLLLFSWKLDTNVVAKFRDVSHTFATGHKYAVTEGSSKGKPDHQEYTDNLEMVRECLHEAAGSLVLLTYAGMVFGEAPLYIHVNHFLALHGTLLAHVFQVGTGTFPFVECFFVNLEQLYEAMWTDKAIPKTLTLPALSNNQLVISGFEFKMVGAGAKCAICSSALDRFIGKPSFPMAYTFSKNDACFPRKIFVSDLTEDEFDIVYEISEMDSTAVGLACGPLCMVQYLRSVFSDLHFAILVGSLPKFHLTKETAMTGERWMTFMKKTLKKLLLDNRALFVRYVLTKVAIRDFMMLPIDNTFIGISCPDHTDPRFSGAYKSKSQKLATALAVANPDDLADKFGLEDAWVQLNRMSTKALDPASPLGLYRTKVASLIPKDGPGEENLCWLLTFKWNEKWGAVNDICIDYPYGCHRLEFNLAPELQPVQPPEKVVQSVLKYLEKLDGSISDDLLIFPVRNNFFSLANYASGVKFTIEMCSTNSKSLSKLLDNADCLLFAREFDMPRQKCFGGFIFREANKVIAVVIPNFYGYLTSETCAFDVKRIFDQFKKCEWRLSEVDFEKHNLLSNMKQSRPDTFRWAVLLYLELVLCYRRNDRGDSDCVNDPVDVQKMGEASLQSIRLHVPSWRAKGLNLEKYMFAHSSWDRNIEIVTFFKELGLDSRNFSLGNRQDDIKVTKKKNAGEIPALASEEKKNEFVGNYWCRLTLTVDLAALVKVEVHNLIVPRTCQLRDLLSEKFGKHFDSAKVLRVQYEDYESKVRCVNLANDVSPWHIGRQYGVSIDHLRVTLTDDGAALAKSMNSHEHWPRERNRRATSAIYNRSGIDDPHFVNLKHRLVWSGKLAEGHEDDSLSFSQPAWITECPDYKLTPEDWNMWNKIAPNLGGIMTYKVSIQPKRGGGRNSIFARAQQVLNPDVAFALCVHLGSKIENINGLVPDVMSHVVGGVPDSGFGKHGDEHIAFLCLPLGGVEGVTGFLIYDTTKTRADYGHVKLFVPRTPVNIPNMTRFIEWTKTHPAEFDVRSQPETFLCGYITTVVGKAPLNFAVVSSKKDLDFGRIFLDQSTDRLGSHVFLIVERSLVADAIGLNKKYRVRTSHLDCKAIGVQAGYSLTALIIRGGHENVKKALLDKNPDYFGEGMLVLTKTAELVHLFLPPEKYRRKIGESLCSLNSSAVWKQLDLGDVGPRFSGQSGVLESDCRPWETEAEKKRKQAVLELANQSKAAKKILKEKETMQKELENKKKREADSQEAQKKEAELKKRLTEGKKWKKEEEGRKKQAKISPEEDYKNLCKILQGLVARQGEVGTGEEDLHDCKVCPESDFDLPVCKDCHVARYCSEGCFKKDRKKHGGKECKEMSKREEVELHDMAKNVAAGADDVIVPMFEDIAK